MNIIDICNYDLIIAKKFKIVNIDVTIIAEKPRLSSRKKKIVDYLRSIFLTSHINLKIKSKERLNILGGRNSIACMAIVLVEEC